MAALTELRSILSQPDIGMNIIGIFQYHSSFAYGMRVRLQYPHDGFSIELGEIIHTNTYPWFPGNKII
jgi:hypothetical protein